MINLNGNIKIKESIQVGAVKKEKKVQGKLNAVPDKLTPVVVLVTDDGLELPAVIVEEETLFTATAKDIRSGTVAASADGVVVGEKDIPAYQTTEGISVVPAGSMCEIAIRTADRYDFTKLQAIVCPYNVSTVNSVAAEAVSIDGKVYAVGSAEAIATVTVDHSTKKINLGIVNNHSIPYIIRYFTFKEEN